MRRPFITFSRTHRPGLNNSEKVTTIGKHWDKEESAFQSPPAARSGGPMPAGTAPAAVPQPSVPPATGSMFKMGADGKIQW